jgi:shikimate kinase
MNKKGRIFLIGMPGSGKSWWAARIAAATGIPAVDMDVLLEAEAGKPATEIFATEGEVAFRKREQTVLHRIIEDLPAAIVACGGGTPCFFDNLEQMKKGGVVVYLKAQQATLLERLSGAEEEKRPLLTEGGSLEDRLSELLVARRTFYEHADFILPVENLSYSNFEEIISQCISQH